MQTLRWGLSILIFPVRILLGIVLVVFVVASLSIGSWCESFLVRLGYQSNAEWLPAFLGIVGYVGLGFLGMAVVGHYLLGWAGAILGPLAGIVLIAVLDHW